MRNLFFVLMSVMVFSCSKSSGSGNGNNTPPGDTSQIETGDTVQWYLTRSDQTALLKKQTPFVFSSATNSYPSITVDQSTTYQTIDGFGYTLTGGSAEVINALDANTKSNLLQELFGNADNSIGVSFLRISIGASDLSSSVYSYDDVTDDTDLSHFSLSKDEKDLIPLLKEILTINSKIKIIATPWSAPAWMKDNNSFIGGSLKPGYYSAYAKYLWRYIYEMNNEGIIIYGITPQNEPLNPSNNPSMLMTAEQERDLIKNYLGPLLVNMNEHPKIICYDHNCDRPDYPQTILSDANAAQYVDGSAFHLYAGDITALGTIHDQFPSKNIYFTEQYTSSNGAFGGDLQWHMKNVMIGSMNNWSKVALEWNLANNPNYGPHTDGGCTECKGALTIGNGITRNVAYYIVAHMSKFIPPVSVRIASTTIPGLQSVAFATPSGKKVLVVLNDGNASVSFNIQFNNKRAQASLAAGSVATYVW